MATIGHLTTILSRSCIVGTPSPYLRGGMRSPKISKKWRGCKTFYKNEGVGKKRSGGGGRWGSEKEGKPDFLEPLRLQWAAFLTSFKAGICEKIYRRTSEISKWQNDKRGEVKYKEGIRPLCPLWAAILLDVLHRCST